MVIKNISFSLHKSSRSDDMWKVEKGFYCVLNASPGEHIVPVLSYTLLNLKYWNKYKEMMEWEGYNYNIDVGLMLFYLMYLSKLDRHAR